MEKLDQIRKNVEKVNTLAGALGMIFIIPLMLLTSADVVGRSFFNKPIPGTFELSEFMLALLILLGAAYTQKEKGHISIDFLASRFKPTLQKALKVITSGLSLFILTILVWQGLVLGISDSEVTDQLRIPKGPFKILVGIGAGLLGIQILFDLIDSLVDLLRRPS